MFSDGDKIRKRLFLTSLLIVHLIFEYVGDSLSFKLRLGAQSVTLLSTLRDPTQLRQRQCATRQQHPPKKVPLGLRGFHTFFCCWPPPY